MAEPSSAALVLAHCLAATTAGSGRLVCIDGRAGSGKTTLADELAAAAAAAGLDPVQVVHMDDLYEGWAGLAAAPARAAREVVVPWSADRPGRYRRWSWAEGRFAEEHVVRPGGLLVLEGVGSGARVLAAHATTLVWLEAPEPVRRERALARDGDPFRTRWDRWAADEAALLAVEGTRERADLMITTADAGAGGTGIP